MSGWASGKTRFIAMRHALDFNLSNVRQMSLEIEGMMRRRAKDIEAKSKQADGFDNDEGQSYHMDALIEDYENYANEWPFLYRESLLLSLCSFFEHHMIDFSDRIAGACGIDFRVRDLKDRGLSGCRTLLQRCGIAASVFSSSNLDMLIELYRYRNRIAHAGGRYNEDTRKRIEKFEDFFIRLDHTEYPNAQTFILVKATAVDRTCDLMESTFRVIGDACVEHLRLRRR